MCQALLRHRTLVGSALGFDLCADPAWDMLLDLYLCQKRDIALSISSISLTSNVSATTAARCLSRLAERSLVTRRSDPSDGRRTFISLTAKGEAAMDRIVDGAIAYRDQTGS